MITHSQQKALKDCRLIDFFSGIGDFHYALASFGEKCVFASEIDKNAKVRYPKNHGLTPKGNTPQIDKKNRPQHDILCARFPC